ncbi:ankyrin repeat domain-containing protein 39 isoform X2 [Nilaparvata lugens]|uniref:ankyrin repeat domain-containing protein 39 isoform X2 n=1 Tax=Nilaparvata lugens TaxID=108931 RepID=UPI00193DF94B|nr:ankyrin repeat domain-containing protein 39 isoform X2 [Nilaparvata lugens]XP_039279933.1 ankyrin repeat domain-containing protein 39 isoform X2 [Nilaparvata lugens]XP_039279934.1 ankyrin repeat domain-containing protein 39 isoform X2 [Nilaparvata lugens]XP_039279935.1 ankyrin repeat domain-containing protein 39 isoform X2 [Nilaparvata lugens]XP_039279936.1 ankyrin repeat domain-containing protein 39 isoform X2 [Nilaparvata lugens]XP_039279937.1 ankyrin repeat domain-containing protein 39 i
MCDESHACCAHAQSSTAQTLDEMDFERGVWSAALDGDEDRVRRLLRGGVWGVDELDKAGYTPLHYAARAGHTAVCRLLLQSGASVNLATRAANATALHRAALKGKEEVVSLLLDFKADALLPDCDGRTALHRAVEGGHCAVAKLLLQACPHLAQVPDKQGHLPTLNGLI